MPNHLQLVEGPLHLAIPSVRKWQIILIIQVVSGSQLIPNFNQYCVQSNKEYYMHIITPKSSHFHHPNVTVSRNLVLVGKTEHHIWEIKILFANFRFHDREYAVGPQLQLFARRIQNYPRDWSMWWTICIIHFIQSTCTSNFYAFIQLTRDKIRYLPLKACMHPF
mgnify:CR=1 FL=1